MPYWRLFYHLVWATAERAPVITGEIHGVVEGSFRAICREEKVLIHALGIMPDHVHMALSIPPRLAIGTFIGQLKGSTSHLINHSSPLPEGRFRWQSEYGVLSFGEKALPDVVSYVEHQPERHAANNLWPTLERTTQEDSRL